MRYDAKNRRAWIAQRNKIRSGDELIALTPDGNEYRIRADDLRDAKGAPIESTPHPQMEYSIPVPVVLPELSFLSKDGDKDQNSRNS